MSAISNVISGLAAQYVGNNFGGDRSKNAINPSENTETSSFQSILQLLDVNGDGSLDTDEIKTGLEGFISNFILQRDLNEDQALNAEETGISPGAFSYLDADSNQSVDTGEIVSEAGRILDGLIPLLDTNNDKRLSGEELAIFELLFSGVSSTNENQEMSTDTIFETTPSGTGETLALNLDTIPERMRQAGFEGSDNALYYALAHIYHYGPGAEMPDDGAGSLAVLNTQREAIHKWFEGEMAKVEGILEKNPQATVTAITNDGKDRCGFRLGAAIVERLKDFGSRVQLGTVLPESEY